MTDSFRLRTAKALTTALQAITVENGFQHDLSDGVFRGRKNFGDETPLPVVTILEDIKAFSVNDGESDNPGAIETWPLIIQGFVDKDPTNPDNPSDAAHLLLADVKQRLMEERVKTTADRRPNILGLGERIGKMTVGSGIVVTPEEVTGKAYFLLTVGLMICENRLDPYA